MGKSWDELVLHRLVSIRVHPLGAIQTEPRSDTLFGAFCWTLFYAEGEAALHSFLDEYEGDIPPLILGDAYPTSKNATYWPMPILGLNPDPGGTYRMSKIRLIPQDILTGLINGSLTSKTLLGKLQSNDLVIEGEYLLPGNDQSQPTDIMLSTRCAVDRTTGGAAEGQLFATLATHFAEGGGLHIPAVVREDAQPRIEKIFRLLGDTGIGADRSVGYGHYAYERMMDLALDVADANASLNLGRLMPSDGEFDYNAGPLSYHLEVVEPLRESGAVHRRESKGTMRFFRPGSILPGCPRRPFAGRMVRYSGNHTHSGRTVVLPARIAEAMHQ